MSGFMNMDKAANNNNDVEEIDLMDLLHTLKEKFMFLLICTILAGTVTLLFTKFFVTPKYTGTSMVYIYNKSSNSQSVTTGDLQVGTQLTSDFMTIAKSRSVMDDVVDKLKLDMDSSALAGQITVENPTGSRILKISASDADPKQAADIANQTAKSLQDLAMTMVEDYKLTIVEESKVPTSPSSPSLGKNTVIGALVGFLLSAVYVIARHLLDTSIKNEDDVRKYLGVNVLASIPRENSMLFEDTHHRKGKGRTKKSRRKRAAA